MTTTRGHEVGYKCFNDCRQEGCPGHVLRYVWHHTSDVEYVEQQDEHGVWQPMFYFDVNLWNAIVKAREYPR